MPSAGTVRDVCKNLLKLRLVSQQQLDDALAQLQSQQPEDLLQLLERQKTLTSMQLQKLRSGDTSGYFLGRFKVLYRIAAGTFARVFRGEDAQTGEVVAVKVLRGRHTVDPNAIQQFRREALLTQNLQHPNITRTIEVGHDRASNQHYIAMEFVEGGNLREFLRIRKKISPVETVRLGAEMVDGLRHALQQGITHRDIKPTNILIASTGQIKWVDFGLAGVVEQGRDAASYSTEQRTVDYAGLEKTTGAPKGDPRSDIFFLGCVFFEMLTGEPAIPEIKDKQARMLRSRFDQLQTAAGRADLPASLARIVDRMLALRPESRYQNYDELLADLRNWSPNESASADETMTASASSATPPTSGQGPPRILVVHSREKVQHLIRENLADRGYQVVLTSAIDRAIGVHQLKPADCWIIDLDTVGPDGAQRYRELVQSQQCTAIFLASEDQIPWLKGFSTDRNACLLKPLTLGPVYRALKQLLPSGKPD